VGILILWCIIGYVVGSIPTGFLISKYGSGVDIRKVGSHSTGATNVLRTCDKKQALATLAIDALKGILFSLIARVVCESEHALIASFFCIVGHVYPVWLMFRGGKGVSTAAGIFLVMEPYFAIISIVIWAVVAKVTKVSSVASILFASSFTGLALYGHFTGITTHSTLIFAIAVLAFLLVTHAGNIRRLLSHEEEVVTEKRTGSRRCRSE
jgi:glycerol-3-phosphate acyltransferase PlsY